MSEPTHTHVTANALQASDAERQLEGRAEVLAAARRSHAELEKLLSGWGWRRALTRSPEWGAALVEGAAALTEALERVHRRAELEAWPATIPVLRMARELSARRERLVALARRRLEALGVSPGHGSLEETLTRLEVLARQSVSWELDSREVLVFETDARWSRHLEVTQKDSGRLATLFGPHASWRGWVPGSGQVRLSNERLIWRSAFGPPRSVRLDDLPEEGPQLDANTREVRAGGDWGVFTQRSVDAVNLAALVELVRWPRLSDALRSGRRLDSRALFPARLEGAPGLCVLGLEHLSFISAGQGPQALGAITGRTASRPSFDVDRLVELLRWLPEVEFESALGRVLAVTASRRWSRAEVVRIEQEYVGQRPVPLVDSLRLECGGESLRGFPKDSQEVVADGLLRNYPRRRQGPWAL
ncbi:hypothetical protein [Myxococcus qinghaiensis]|uniref:hypothetical protein n=1 Tax=Myxococcus qinghaiensis TaxID=2906758 RepID=UPI0020A76BEA|nr:hypothetical protein [Myxococcus qinghaiensis]MCP3167977.1 hypothetical protein [Myxococcus qinghaiensis]